MNKIHLRSQGLFVNAGMRFPLCQASARLLDCDKSAWETTGIFKEVTCKHCLNIIRKETK